MLGSTCLHYATSKLTMEIQSSGTIATFHLYLQMRENNKHSVENGSFSRLVSTFKSTYDAIQASLCTHTTACILQCVLEIIKAS